MNVWLKIRNDLSWYIVSIFLATWLLSVTFNYFRVGYDDSDNHKAGIRSGVAVHTDNLTGCQYLSTRGGGITPRVTRTGMHICSKE